MDNSKPILVTITSPTAAGKSYLYSYIRDVAKLPCLVSTTTRPPRAGEVEGIDYFFITEEESLRLEAEDQFAELALYGGVRYGVTKTEFHSKLAKGLAFLIVEPSGIDHYAKPATDIGATHYKIFIETPLETRVERFKARTFEDIRVATEAGDGELVDKHVNAYFKRLESMLTYELTWKDMASWSRVIDGRHTTKYNLDLILDDISTITTIHDQNWQTI